MGDIIPDDFDVDESVFDEQALNDLETIMENAGVGSEPDINFDPESVVTQDDLEEKLGDVGGITEEEAAEISQQYSLGGLHHIIEGDCDHPEHQKIREKLGIQSDSEAGEEQGGSEGAEEAEPEGDSSDEESEADVSDSGGSQESGGAWGTHG